MTYNELAELFKREGGDAQVCFSVISQNQILFGNNDTKKDIISFKNEEPIKLVKEVQEEQISKEFINALGTMLNDGLPDRYLVSEERIKESAELLFSIARKQLKNEMQEWSEEDEQILNDIIKDLVHPWNEYIPDRIEDEIKWLKKRLKSLKELREE